MIISFIAQEASIENKKRIIKSRKLLLIFDRAF